jgi:hypothetical protein
MEALKLADIAKKIRIEKEKIQSDYGKNVDKYARNVVIKSMNFNWYKGSFGNSSVYNILHDQFDHQTVCDAASSFMTQNFELFMEHLAIHHESLAKKEMDKLLKQKEEIENCIAQLTKL